MKTIKIIAGHEPSCPFLGGPERPVVNEDYEININRSLADISFRRILKRWLWCRCQHCRQRFTWLQARLGDMYARNDREWDRDLLLHLNCLPGTSVRQPRIQHRKFI